MPLIILLQTTNSAMFFMPSNVLMKKRKNDIVMRLGVDEFAAYFVDILSEEAASEKINKFFEEISKIQIEPMTEEINVSLGAVLYRDGLTFDSIYKIADRGVYDSKLNKGSSYTFPG